MDDYQSHDAVGLAALVREKKVSAAGAAGRGAGAGGPGQRPDQRRRGRRRPAPVGRRQGRSPACRSCSRTSATTSRATRPAAAPGRWPRHRPPRTPPSSQRWLDAGLVIFGKTNTPEFGAKGVTESHLFGPARNPWNTDHTPGGSSGGAAAAVAAGIVPLRGGQRRRRLDPDPGLGLRPVRPQALARAGALRPAGPGGARAARRPTASSRARSATPPRCSTCSWAERRTAPTCRRCPPTSYADEVGQDPARSASALHGERHQPDAGPRGDRRGDRGGSAPRVARPPGRAARQRAVRRRGAGQGLPHHLVRLRRRLGRPGQGDQRLR